jgi:hypothetical protein
MRGAEWSGASLKVVTRALNALTAGGGRRRRAPRVRHLSNDLFNQKRLDRFGTLVPMKSPKSDLLGLNASQKTLRTANRTATLSLATPPPRKRDNTPRYCSCTVTAAGDMLAGACVRV